MIILRNYNIKENMKFIFILKNLTLIILIWICYLKGDKCIFNISLENEYKVQGLSFQSFSRLLAKQGFQKELKRHIQREYLSDNIMNNNVKNVLEHTSTYGQLNKSKNDLDLYMRGYKRRYSKKSGLGKLDCYCEKKVFHKIEDIDKLIEKMQNDKKLLKKKLCQKFGIRFILFSLIPVFGLIIPLLHNDYFQLIPNCFDDCQYSDHNKNSVGEYAHKDEDFPRNSLNKDTWYTIEIVDLVLYCITSFIVLSVFIYIFIKFIKYQRLKACRSKMSIKEYCKFCKSIFI
ncbi:Plasmodium exported protein, unknown function [Plasmodium vivax]|uniref:Variable surface protein n=1 Tax=Plasmodium vivax TaxID=5855 RepID=A0A1G4EBU2_PLAVI|nr:Plasmodium exported protein, unknown function [Plasmodium vivax]VUZ99512.1 Plasmodium exported protein, unknown function [Plasmodium vivax]